MRAGGSLGERLQRFASAVAVGDFDTAASFHREDAVFDMSPMGMGTFEGRRAIRALFADWFAAYDTYVIELQSFEDLGSDVAFNTFSYRGQIAGSDQFVTVTHAYITVWSDGLIDRTSAYSDSEDARAAARRLAAERSHGSA